MPRTLWRYILIEVGRLVLISTAVLVVVIAFAATVKPLADGKLTAVDAIRFMFYAAPPMLAYALPFAAGFGTTLGYHRFAQDNEATACFAGGLSHAKILAPALGLGLGLTLALGVLNDQVIPRFLTRMERLIAKDLAQIMIRSLEQGESAAFGNAEIHANAVARAKPEKGSLADDRILLRGMAAMVVDDGGEVLHEATAPEAWVLLFKAKHLPEAERGDIRPDQTVIRLIAPEAHIYSLRDRNRVGMQSFTSKPYPMPSAFDDDPKFLTGGQLKRLRDDPERMNWIDEKRLALAADLAAVRVVAALRERVRSLGNLEFNDPGGRRVRVLAPALTLTPADDGWLLRTPGAEGRVEVEVYHPNGTLDRYSARRIRLSRTKAAAGDLFNPVTHSSLTFELAMEGVQILPGYAASGQAGNEVPRLGLSGLVAPNDPYTHLRTLTSAQLIAECDGTERESVAASARRLEADISKLNREISSKQHERVAMALSCFVMVFIGAVMAMRLRGAMPLVVYLWSFFPALATVILISSGGSTIHRTGMVGVPVLWSGVVGLAAFAVFQFARLRRH